ncbi:MAG: lipopolysaccharide biosynthesis protein, partial [bacterium]|nr:lipopolysaccharide biosynthesis protein [bacterium]
MYSASTNSESPLKTEQIVEKSLQGGLWVVFSNWVGRTLSFLQNVVVARLLFPEDFGLMGMASVALELMNTFTQSGLQAALIHRKELDQEAANAAWILTIFRGLLLFAALWIGAPWAGLFFREDKVVALIRVLAFAFLIESFGNIWIVGLRKDLQFKRHAYSRLLIYSVSFVVTLVACFQLRSIWGLVIGRLAGALTQMIGSYIFALQRPRFGFNRSVARELMSYGRHIIVLNIIIYLTMQADDIFVGRVLGKKALGFYVMAFALASLPGTIISQVAARITFPLFSKIRQDSTQTKSIFKAVVEMMALLAFPLSGALLVGAPQIIQIAYGEKWLPALPAMCVLCIFGLTRALSTTLVSFLQALGLPNKLARFAGLQLLLMALIIYPLGTSLGIVGVSICITLTSGFGLSMLLFET